MINVTLKGGVVKQYEAGVSVADIAKDLGMGLYKAACAAKIDGQVTDLRTLVTQDAQVEILTFEDEDGKKAFWHTASHILAQAVLHLYPNAKYAIGPAIDNGFYYDFDVEKPFTAEDLQAIEKEMAKIVKSGIEISRFELDPVQAKELMKEQPYKLELIEKHSGAGEKISFYKQGDFTDLCAGPHLMSTAPVKAVKLTSSTGAYWHGDSNLPMLCRVYGTAYPKASELEAYLAAVEEAKKRDHNIIGRQLKYFCNSDVVGQGLPLLMPKGAKLFQILNRYIQDKEEYEYGYLMTRTPLMAKSDLYKISGHWGHYKEGMFVLGDEEKDKEVFALRPMTCPFQYQVYMNDMHSYRDLPLRYGETSTLFRNEASGEMHGLIRVRQFTISEGHLILRPDQLEEEFRQCVKLLQEVMTDIGLIDDLSYRLSKWDPNDQEKYIGTPEMWDEAEGLMRNILDHIGLEYKEAVGEAAFYGPKLDVQIKNVHGKEDTLITVQIDLMLARQFEMTYIDKDGEKKYPYIIHRTSLGCYERTMALLLEKFAGALPMWLSPEQIRVLPIDDGQLDFAKQVMAKLRSAGLRVELDDRREKIGYKIREAQVEKIPYMLIIGDKELESGSVAVRSRKAGDLGAVSVDEFLQKALEEVRTKAK
ncbi:threonine--tRNA ligase [Youxingia wuxianensis]|uniref:Threonine--tRNA ligase n=1 Tax=Youxingia wuxianensis TaxID=2763678 RepID=A0A926EQS1_9FIRM|nr:threonine--tRNA ligase [Youxingia wuxianensis]MBC8584649.1 threonine--tRNA ligase [Youxingia wuxianensis]